jgi:hypothetical protein
MTLPACELIIGRERRTHGSPGIASGRLHPHIRKISLAQDFSVGDAVQRDAASKAEIL